MITGLHDDESAASVRSIRVRCHELAPRLADLPANLEMIEAAILDAVADDVDLLVLPELATSGYYLRDAGVARDCAIHTTDPIWQEWAALLRPGMTVVLGFCEDLDGVLHNSAATLDRTGVIAVYRKTHLWDEEQNIFTPGGEPPTVIETPAGKLGVLICYDLEFPEMPRSLAVNQAEIIAVPTNWPVVPRPPGEHPPEVLQAMAAARSSCVAIACCDRSGAERGHEWTQGTSIIGVDGWLTGTKTNGRVDAVVEIADSRTRIGAINDVLADRRPDIYFSPMGNV